MVEKSYIPISMEPVPLSPDLVPHRPLHMPPTLASVFSNLPLVLSARIKPEKLAGNCFMGLFSKTQIKWGTGLEDEPLCSPLCSKHPFSFHTPVREARLPLPH